MTGVRSELRDLPGTQGPDDSVARLVGTFERAASVAGRRTGVFMVAGRRWRISAAGTAMFDLLAAPLRHLATDGGPAPDFTLLAWDRHLTGEPLPERAAGSVHVPGRGPADEAHLLALHQLEERAFSAYAPREGLGIFWTDDARACDRTLPLRFFLHWWLSPLGYTLTHAGGVGLEGRGVLVTGAGGLGKSTSCVSALLAGLDFIGDDFVLVDGGGPEVVAHSVSCSTRFTAASLARLPAVVDAVADAGPADDGKRFLLLYPRWQERLVSSLAIDAIVVPAIVDRPTSRVVAISSGEALRAMVSTLVATPGDRDVAFGRIAAVARRLPCYRLEAGADPAAVGAALGDLVASLRPR